MMAPASSACAPNLSVCR